MPNNLDQWKSMLPQKYRPLQRIFITALAGFLFFKFVLIPVRVNSERLPEVTSVAGFNFVNTMAYFYGEPSRGDVVAIRTSGTSIMHIKRVVGLPKEEILILGGTVFVDSQPLQEPYVTNNRGWNLGDRLLDADEYFVMDDNRAAIKELQRFGKVKETRIVGRLLF